jgi:hypothetical protein
MIIGAHSILYSKRPEADRAFLRDVLGFPHVDGGEGWLIFGLPPSEVAVHPADENDVHELYLMCADIDDFVARMERARVACSAVQAMGWGRLTHLTLPGGGKLGVYEPRHARPKTARANAAGTGRRKVRTPGAKAKKSAGRRAKRTRR